MKNPFAMAVCEHGVRSDAYCGNCRSIHARGNWLWDGLGIMRFHMIIAIAFAGVASLLMIAIGISTVFEAKQCARYEQISNANTDWGFFGGCYVETEDGYWVTLGTYKDQSNIKLR